VFALKDDGRYRARTVAKGFSQVPGKDFQENFAPVINDTTFHMMLTLKKLMNLEAGQFDIETAFLYGTLDEELWMTFPDGYEEYVFEKHKKQIDTTVHCLKLEKSNLWFSPSSKKMVEEIYRSIEYNRFPSK